MADRYASLKQGLVGCWIPSISGSGLLLPDLSGRGNNGALTNMDASDWVSSQYGRALDFDGTNDYVSTTRASGISSQSSVCAWVYPRDIATYQIVISEDPTASALSRNFVFGYGLTSGKLIAVDFRGGLFDIYESAASLIANTWQHISWTRRTAGMVFHVNGVQSGSTFSYTSALNTNNVATRIGARELGDGFTNALVNDIRIYNRALTEPEIRLLASEPGIGFKPAKKLSRFSQRFTYNPPKARNYSVIRVKETDYASLREGLAGAWCPSLPNGGSGNTLPDVSGYGNHGSLVNMSPDDWVSSQYGRALDFDGVNDCVLPDRAIGVGALAGKSITVSVWVNPANVSVRQAIIADWNTGGFGESFALQIYSPGTIGLFLRSPELTPTNISSISTNQWVHIAVSTSSNGTKVYKNSVEVYSDSTSINLNTGSRIAFGRGGDYDGLYYNGRMDDIRIYNRVLSEPEIRLLASRPGIGLRQESHRQTFYQFPSGARRKRILTGMP